MALPLVGRHLALRQIAATAQQSRPADHAQHQRQRCRAFVVGAMRHGDGRATAPLLICANFSACNPVLVHPKERAIAHV